MFTRIILVGLLLQLAVTASGAHLLAGPEGVIYDSLYDRYLVSNWDNGTIVQIDPDRTQSYFQTGLGNPSGMHIKDSILYVSCNNQIMFGLSLATGAFVFNRDLPTYGLHGITSDTSGFLYACDWNAGRVFRIDPANGDYTVQAVGIYRATGIAFDAASNRLIVVGWGGNRDITAVALPTGEVSTITTVPFGDLDDIQRDQFGNYYITTFNVSPAVYKFDSAFTLPGEPICDGYGDNCDCYYNTREDLLIVTHYGNNSYEFIQRVIMAEFDTSWGEVPLDVQFEGSSEYEVVEWLWDFGDGGSATGVAPSHTYTQPGVYDVQLSGITNDNDTLNRTVRSGIAALADTLWVDPIEVYVDSSIDVIVHTRNTISVSKLLIPVKFSEGDLDLSVLSVEWSTNGCRTEGLDYQAMVHLSPSTKQFTIKLQNTGMSADVPAGSGPVLRIHFEPDGTPQVGQSADVSVSGYGTYLPVLSGALAEFEPKTVAGSITIIDCCLGIRGNVDSDEFDQINIADLIFLVEYIFSDGIEPTCPKEANVNGDIFGRIDISDLVYLVDYMFNQGSAPAPCP